MRKHRFQLLVQQLYDIVDELEEMFPGRRFTPDGHMVGSMGECFVADAYGLVLQQASNKGFDAVTDSGIEVEIKTTQTDRYSFRHPPEHSIVVKLRRDGSFEEVYNGPGALIWDEFEGRKLPTNGQYQISANKLRRLNEAVASSDTVRRVD